VRAQDDAQGSIDMLHCPFAGQVRIIGRQKSDRVFARRKRSLTRRPKKLRSVGGISEAT
jgi:hypothetical protein